MNKLSIIKNVLNKVSCPFIYVVLNFSINWKKMKM